MTSSSPNGANCSKTATEVPNLKLCAYPPTALAPAKTAHWKSHKKICAKQAQPASSPTISHNTDYDTPHVKNLEKRVAKPFTRLDKNAWLHDRPEKDVYKLLIDRRLPHGPGR